MKNSFKTLWLPIVLTLVLPSVSQTASVSKSGKPNIILIVSDDMGYSDLGCYGSEISTLNLDALAKDGLCYRHFYNQARCCPSRASLMTGLYPHQAGMGWMSGADHELPGYRGQLNEHCVTIPQVLKTAGYLTYAVGKWHLQLDRDAKPSGPNHDWPLQRGFDKFYGILKGGGSYFDPATLCRDNALITPFNDPEYQTTNYYFTDAITANALKYLKEDHGGKPFFMYVAYTAPHWPLQAPAEAIRKYRGKYDAGWEIIRRRRFDRMKQLGLIGTNVTLSPLDTMSWEQEPDKKAMSRRMETYAAMIDIMDQGVGQIVKELKEQGAYQNTLILFLSDNGGNAEGMGFGGPEGQTRPVDRDPDRLKPLPKNEPQLQNVPGITRDGRVIMSGKQIMAGPEDTYLAYLRPWAQVSNTPFRKYKHFVYEGGIAAPLIVHWPAGITSPGEYRDQIGNVIDIMPTLVELTGANYPITFNGQSITPAAGVSLVPSFVNHPMNCDAICWEHEMNRAVRSGKWKLVSAGGMIDGGYGKWKYYINGPWELYDMENDPTELNDLSAKYPDQAARLLQIWQSWAKKVSVYPTPWKTQERVQMRYIDPLY